MYSDYNPYGDSYGGGGGSDWGGWSPEYFDPYYQNERDWLAQNGIMFPGGDGFTIGGGGGIGGSGGSSGGFGWEDILRAGTAAAAGAAGGSGGRSAVSSLLGGSPSWLKDILSLLGIGSGIAGNALNSKAQQQAIDLLTNYSKQLQGLYGPAAEKGGATMDQANAGANGVLGGSNPFTSGLLNGLLPAIQQQGGNIPNLFDAVREQAGNLGDFAGSVQGPMDVASGLASSGGRTADTQTLMQWAQDLMRGRGSARETLSTSGQGIVGNGGMTPALAQALQDALGASANGGSTPYLDQAFGQVSRLVGQGGETDALNQLQQRGLDLTKVNPLISTDQAASFAADRAGRQFANYAKNKEAQLAARGQGAGSIVASGAGNDALADYATEGLGGVSDAMQSALLNQQGLNLGLFGQGSNMSLSAADQMRQRLATALNSLTGLTGVQTGRLATGLSGTQGLTGAQTNLLNSGTNQLVDFNNMENQGANLANAILGLETNRTLGGLSSLQGLIGTGGTLQNNVISQLLNSATSQGTLQQGNLGQMLSALLGGQSGSLGASQLLGSQGNNWLDYAQGLIGALTNNTGRAATQIAKGSPLGEFLQSLSGLASGININRGGSGGSGSDSGGTTQGPAPPPGSVSTSTGTNVPGYGNDPGNDDGSN